MVEDVDDGSVVNGGYEMLGIVDVGEAGVEFGKGETALAVATKSAMSRRSLNLSWRSILSD
jgi:hypothetical protein